MPYNSGTGAYERRTTTVIDATPDGDTVAVAIDVKLDTAADDAVLDLNHHKTNGNHYPATSVHTDSRYLDQSPAGIVSWKDGVPAPDAALKDMSNVASGAIAPAKVAQDASNRFITDAQLADLAGIGTGVKVTKSSDQNLSINTETKITWNTEDWDDGGTFASSNFVAPVAGRYLVNVSLFYGNVEANRLHNTRVKVNDSVVLAGIQSSPDTGNMVVSVSGILSLAVNDIVNVYALAGGTTARAVLSNGTATYFQIHRL